jgi:hypothetical protein
MRADEIEQDIEHKLELVKNYRTRQRVLEEQAALFGLHVPAHIQIEIGTLSEKIQTCEQKIETQQNMLISLAPTGSINKIWFEHGVQENSRKGMMVHIAFSVVNLKGIECNAAVFFYSASGKQLIDQNNSYHSTSGKVAISRSFTPKYDNSRFNDFTLFIPYDEFHLGYGKHELMVKVQLSIHEADYYFIEAENTYFSANIEPDNIFHKLLLLSVTKSGLTSALFFASGVILILLSSVDIVASILSIIVIAIGFIFALLTNTIGT